MRSAAELRRWWRDPNERTIWGFVYNDPLENWTDGDLGAFDIVELIESVNFYVLKTNGILYLKLDKDEEIKHED